MGIGRRRKSSAWRGRRDRAADEFEAARGIIEAIGLRLIRRTAVRYQVVTPEGAILNVYPTTWKMFSQGGKIQFPPVPIKSPWSLLELAEAIAGM